MNSREAIKRIRQETAPATYMPDFDKEECLQVVEDDIQKLELIDDTLNAYFENHFISKLDALNEIRAILDGKYSGGKK